MIKGFPYAIVLTLVGCWYTSSSLNAVATQSFTKAQGLGQNLMHDFGVMMVVTCAQLFIGSALGCLVLLACQVRPVVFKAPSNSWWFLVAVLHGGGSWCTNVGFAYGSASIVQVIKLLEPVETLMVSKLLGSTSTVISSEISCALVLLISGTMGTLSGWDKLPHPVAVIFATLSGLCLASRNATKKRIQEKTSVVNAKSTGATGGFAAAVQQFVDLSTWGAVWLSIPAILHMIVYRETPLIMLDQPKMIVFHGAYNLASLSVLNYVSALTHSVLNVGKRLTNIVVAMIQFPEQTDLGRIGAGLLVASVGMLWYASLSKGGSSAEFWGKMKKNPTPLLFLLCVLSFVYVGSSGNALLTIEEQRPQLTSSSRCEVGFKAPDMDLCDDADSDLHSELAYRIIEHGYSSACTVHLSRNEGHRSDRRCLWIGASSPSSWKSGDAVWMTKQSQTMNGLEWFETPYAPPEFLVPHMLEPVHPAEMRHEFCFVYPDSDTAMVRFFEKNWDTKGWQPMHMIAESSDNHLWWEGMYECDHVASSSIHSIVLADAIGIPTLWFAGNANASFGLARPQDRSVFENYFKSLKRDISAPVVELELLNKADLYSQAIPLPERQRMWEQMLRSFPYHLFERD